jgi:hypothetical protein
MLNHSRNGTSPIDPTLPNFFIVGAPKAGTTSLCYYVGQHPDVYVSPIKSRIISREEIRLGNIDAQWQHWAQRDARAGGAS